MTLTIDIAPDTETRLAAKAYQHGLALPDYARQVLEQAAQDAPQPVMLATDKATRHAQIRALVHAPAAVREATLAASAQAVADDYRHDPEVTALSRSLDEEPIHED